MGWRIVLMVFCALLMRSEARTCTVSGRTYAGNSQFSYTDGCYRFNCDCNSDGSWDCPATRTVNTCDTRTGATTGTRITNTRNTARTCTVNGRTYAGNRQFSYTDGCYQFNCDCNADGSWDCPATRTVNTCSSTDTRTGATTGTRTTGTGSVSTRNTARTCTVNGRTYAGNSQFSYTDGCYRFNCDCNADGSWDCPAARTVNTCTNGRSGATTGTGSTSTRNTGTWSSLTTITGYSTNRYTGSRAEISRQGCNINGRMYRVNSPFTMTRGCIRYRQCVCNADGAWSCPGEHARRIPGCTGAETTGTWSTTDGYTGTGTYTRQGCNVYGQIFNFNTRFTMTRGCVRYRRCICNATGAWNCPAEHAQRVPGCTGSGTTSTGSNTVVNTGTITQQRQGCNVYGQIFNFNTRFTMTRGCVRYRRCICNATGAWNCPAEHAQRVPGCTGSGITSTGSNTVVNTGTITQQIQGCNVNGRIYSLNSPFTMIRDCINYRRCVCNADGSWNCPGEHAQRIPGCGSTGTTETGSTTIVNTGTIYSTPQGCNVYGRVYNLNSRFTMTHECVQYRQCVCHVDGSWNCPGEHAQRVPGCGSGRTTETGSTTIINSAQGCNVYGRVYGLNTRFAMTHDCVRYRNCICRADGSWNCPGEHAQRVPGCGGSGTTETGSTSIVNSGQGCSVYGQHFNYNTRFTMTRGCIRYRQCFCNATGAWECLAEHARSIPGCIGSGTTSTGSSTVIYTITQATTPVQRCNVYGRVYSLNSRFTMTHDCVRYGQCVCHVDGSWNCPDEHAQRIPGCVSGRTTGTGSSTIINPGQGCSVYGQHFNYNTRFTMTRGCIRYRECFCNATGAWECLAEHARSIPGCIGSGTTSTGGSTVIYTITQSTAPVQRCNVYGRVYSLNSRFTMTHDCVRYGQCVCHVDGSWNCPGEHTQRIPGCVSGRTTGTGSSTIINPGQGCRVYNQVIPYNTRFSMTRDCIRYRRCFCNTTGAWECPAEHAARISGCRGSGTTSTGNSTATNTITQSTQGCNVYGRIYSLNRRFTMTRDCIRYRRCFCNATGAWNCPAEQARRVPGCTSSGTTSTGSSTVINTGTITRPIMPYGQHFNRNTRFTMTRGCIRYRRCFCNATGAWNCPAEHAQRISGCTGSGTTSTGSTTVVNTGTITQPRQGCSAYGQNFNAYSYFSISHDCIRYRRCFCNATGAWNCPAEYAQRIPGCTNSGTTSTGSSTIVNTGTINQASQGCRVYGQHFPYNRHFRMTRNCIRYNHCFCNATGAWNCPAEHAQRIPSCRGTGTTTGSSTVVNTGHIIRSPRTCNVNGRTYAGNSQFSYTDGCYQFNCDCNADGSWDCPATRTVNTCSNTRTGSTTGSGSISTRNTARTCTVNGRTYAGNRQFSYTDGCYQFNCDCNSDGSWDCPATRTVNTCDTRTGATTGTGSTGTRYTVTRTGRRTGTGTATTGNTDTRTGATTGTGSTSTRYTVTRTGSRTGTGTATTGNTARTCTVNGREYAGNSPFSYTDGCYQFNCDCNGDGSWNCPSSRTVNTCSNTRTGATTRTGSTSTRYTVTRTGSRTGTGTATTGNTGARTGTATTGTGSSNTRNTGGCRRCNVQGRIIAAQTTFSMTEGCFLYNCDCICDGSWNCPAERTQNVCNETP